MNQLDWLFTQSKSPQEYSIHYCEYLQKLISLLDHSAIELFIERLIQAREQQKTVYLMGNGGSAAICEHFATDLTLGHAKYNKSFKAISLTTNLPFITALANDFGYEEIFVKQLELSLVPGDVIVAFSVSGNSLNILKALEYARNRGHFVIGLTGVDGGELKRKADLVIHCPTQPKEYGPAEDLHHLVTHLVSTYVLRRSLISTDQVSVTSLSH